MQLHLGEFGPVRVFGRTLVVVCAYRGGTKPAAPFAYGSGSIRYLRSIVGWLTLVPLRRHIASLRDYYANPRQPDMQLAMVRTLLDQSAAEQVRVIFDARLSLDEPQRSLTEVGKSETADLTRWVPDLGNIDTVILVYPDALGLTFGALERRIFSAGARNVVVLTGRRRLFPLSSPARRSFHWRRLLASTRIVELMAAVAIIPVAAVLAGYDSLKAGGRSQP